MDGRHNGRWAALQDAERKDENLPKFKPMFRTSSAPTREDPRVLWWETYNEPNLQDPFTVKLREQAYPLGQRGLGHSSRSSPVGMTMHSPTLSMPTTMRTISPADGTNRPT